MCNSIVCCCFVFFCELYTPRTILLQAGWYVCLTCQTLNKKKGGIIVVMWRLDYAV